MQECFSTLVKIYSTYSEPIPAPDGFDAPSVPLQTSKWQHFPTGTAISLSIEFNDDKFCFLRLKWSGRTLETVGFSLISSDRAIRFTARSPSISCKYILQENNVSFIRRFQVVLHNDEDFNQLCLLLMALRLVVKPARPCIPPRQQSEQSNAGLFFNPTGAPLKQNQAAILPAVHYNRPLANKPLTETKCSNASSHLECEYPLNSQLPSDSSQPLVSINVMRERKVTPTLQPCKEFANRSIQTHLEQAILAEQRAMSSDNQSSPLNIAPKPTNRELPKFMKYALPGQKWPEKSRLDSRRDFENGSQDVVLDNEISGKSTELVPNPPFSTGPVETIFEPASQLGNDFELGQVRNPAAKMVTGQANEVPQLTATRLAGSSDLKLSQEHCKKKECIRDISEVSVVTNQGNDLKDTRISNRDITGKKPNTQTSTKKNDVTSKTLTNDVSPRIRVSKKIIKAKLKDDYFMRWVSKVEKTLTEMK